MPSLRLAQGQTSALFLADDAPAAAGDGWRAIPPHLVDLSPMSDRRSCLALAVRGAKLGLGRCHVRARDACGKIIGHWYLTITGDDREAQAERQARLEERRARAEADSANEWDRHRRRPTELANAVAGIEDDEPMPESYGP